MPSSRSLTSSREITTSAALQTCHLAISFKRKNHLNPLTDVPLAPCSRCWSNVGPVSQTVVHQSRLSSVSLFIHYKLSTKQNSFTQPLQRVYLHLLMHQRRQWNHLCWLNTMPANCVIFLFFHHPIPVSPPGYSTMALNPQSTPESACVGSIYE